MLHSVNHNTRMVEVRLIKLRNIFGIILIFGSTPTQQVKLDIKEFGSAMLGSACSAIGWECCRSPFLIPPDVAIKNLETTLNNEFFGQHLAADTVLNALRSHLHHENSNKALVLSFHGWAGSGKTYLAELIMKSLYKEGSESKFVKFYMASYHFPDPNASKVLEYQETLRDDILRTVGRCERALFVFDEVDKTPPKVFDALVPFIQHPGKKFEGLNFKRSIFIFLSNIGASDITKITYTNWKDGQRRENLRFTDFEGSLQREAFNNKDTGLTKSRVIDKVLVDFYIPFLPMEREHVISCTKAEIAKVKTDLDPEKIADSLAYWPPLEKLYSQTGCKKVENLVKFYDAQEKYGKAFNYDETNENEHDEL
ncbi:torsin-1B [Folsomia candida]|uniref:torsin-1B n=1 Tax=Folsomia candida TaxID=158441 RepID=UPI000B8FEDBD|nr:torsin-1B [Folsomia candida]